jgi:trehalose 6-phosphate phosphatase
MMDERKERLWIFDFDGTLSPLVPSRSAARLDPSCKDLLRHLVFVPDQRVAVLSSRQLDDLVGRIPVPGLFLGGGSGLEWQMPDGERHLAGRDLQEKLNQRRKTLLPKIRSMETIPGVEMEDKKWSIAIHVRKASMESRTFVHLLLEDWKPLRRIRKFRGPDVIELQLLSEVDKAYGVRRLCDILDFEPEGRLIYSGDDENDAMAMQWVLHLKGKAFTVGKTPLVRGSRVVNGPAALAREVRKLVGMRESNPDDERAERVQYESL